MLAPIDKIISGANRIIQIEITRKCNLNCSECTRLLPFRRDDLEMDLNVFRKAVESVRDWPGIVALFGGNPCCHSRFEEICGILAEFIPPERRGLWTNALMGKGEVAAQTFRRGMLNLNAHGDGKAAAEIERWFPGRLIHGSHARPSWHSSILVSYRDLGINEGEWVRRRESCDLNQRWSGVIQQRNGKALFFFCEVAGSIDSLLGGSTGVEVYPGIWRESMNRFGHQVSNCDMCGIPHKCKGYQDKDQKYAVSASWDKILPVPRGKTIIEPIEEVTAGCKMPTDYMRRFS